MTRVGPLFVILLTACSGGDDASAPLAEVPGTLTQLAVNDTSIFAIDAMGGIVEIALDGTLVGTIETSKKATEVVAGADWVAWIEPEGSGTIIRRRRNGTIESTRTFDPHLIATAAGLFFSDSLLVAQWQDDGVIQRLATPGASAKVLDVDGSYAYVVEADTSIVKYMRDSATGDKETLLPTSSGASARGGQLAYRTADGIRLRDLFTTFDRVVGAPPVTDCELVIAGSAVFCGKYRALDGMTDEPLTDPVNGTAVAGGMLYWMTESDGNSQIRAIVPDQRAK